MGGLGLLLCKLALAPSRRLKIPAVISLSTSHNRPSYERPGRRNMTIGVAELRKKITRRAALGSFGAMAAIPALAKECSIGPPAHEKGPLVWMDMDQVELDAAYDQSFYAPLLRQDIARWASNSDSVRTRLGMPRRESYGSTDVEKLDIYRTNRPNAPIFVFIHGGAWLGGEAKNYAFPAELFVNAGAHYVVLDFVAVKAANGDLRVMADQVRRAVAWVYKNAANFGGDPNRLYVGGHSSGGHLCGVTLVTDWSKEFGLPTDLIKGGLCMSGMYDMKPVRLSKRSSYVKFDDDMEAKMSSQHHLDLLHAPIVVTYGTNETPEFQRRTATSPPPQRRQGLKPRTTITWRCVNRSVTRMGRTVAPHCRLLNSRLENAMKQTYAIINVRLWHKADIPTHSTDVRFWG
jgi:arylformamidase